MFTEEENEFYRTEPARVMQSIGVEEVNRLFQDPELELEPEFIGFLAVYADLKGLPKDFTIIDKRNLNLSTAIKTTLFIWANYIKYTL